MALDQSLQAALDSAIEWSKRNQHPRGYWVGKLDTNSSMEAEWILGMHCLGVTDDPKRPGVIRAILEQQRPDGAWGVFYQAPAGEISATVECYAALRCVGMDPDSEPLRKAREWILANGGLRHLRVFTKIWLALIGEWPWKGTPQLPPEIIFTPTPWFPFNIYQFSSWARGTLVPLAILSALRPVHPLPEPLDELFPEGRRAFDYRVPRRYGRLSWEALFLAVDRLLRWYGRSPVQPFRSAALKLCREWIVRHQEADGAWSGIQPPWIYSLLALKNSGYALTHPVLVKGIQAFNEPWAVKQGESIYLQASNSPVWDTMLTLLALVDYDPDYATEEFAARGLAWLLNEEVRTPGDWSVMTKGVEPSGWAFEYENDWYPDFDDTAVVIQLLAALQEERPRAHPGIDTVLDRATKWLLAHQCSNGGWASFDRDNDSAIVTKLPFCDFGEVLDPPSVDVTAHVIEALGRLGRGLDDPAVRRAIDFVLSEQEPEGPWFGRWGVNYVYGTGAVLPALKAVGYDMTAGPAVKAADWLMTRQNGDGGWGETCSSYMSGSLRGVGPSTASQTAWALMGLLAMPGKKYENAIGRATRYLLQTQRADGTWDELYYTGTGFPGYGLGKRLVETKSLTALRQGLELGRGFMLRYNMYRHYFPLMALGRVARLGCPGCDTLDEVGALGAQ
jgi:squalene-hopene/tetraprenyl-beta-curcumene cyclase